jgi:hypothetical protein
LGKKPWKAWVKRGVKLAVGLLVAWMVARHVSKVWGELGKSGRKLEFDPAWLGASVALYILGLGAFGMFFARIMGASATPVALWPAIRAYVISHLGKYVPGKAMVVVLRAGLVAPFGARPATAAFATLYETLVMMAAGGLIAAGIFGAMGGGPDVEIPLGGGKALGVPLALLSLGMGGPLFLMAQARVFPTFLLLFRAPFPGVGPEAVPRFTTSLLVEGLGWSVVGWALWGMSQVAVARGIGLGGTAAMGPGTWPVVVASVALATLAGFVVAVFPGGLVVREGVLMAALGPTLGAEEAVVAALALRLSWVAAELLASGLAVAIRPAATEPAAVAVGIGTGLEAGDR